MATNNKVAKNKSVKNILKRELVLQEIYLSDFMSTHFAWVLEKIKNIIEIAMLKIIFHFVILKYLKKTC